MNVLYRVCISYKIDHIHESYSVYFNSIDEANLYILKYGRDIRNKSIDYKYVIEEIKAIDKGEIREFVKRY